MALQFLNQKQLDPMLDAVNICQLELEGRKMSTKNKGDISLVIHLPGA